MMENDARLRSRATVEILNSLAKNEPKGMGIWDLTRDPEVHIKDRTTMSKHCNPPRKRRLDPQEKQAFTVSSHVKGIW